MGGIDSSSVHPNMWFIAQLVERVSVQGSGRPIVHINYLLLNAADAAQALDKAKSIGRTSNITYSNPQGRKVDVRFVGIRELSRVHDEIGDGAELLYTETTGLSPLAIRRLVRPRKELSAFRSSDVQSDLPNYASGDVLRKAEALSMQNRRVSKKSGT